ncbi:uncharacterized protein N7477_009918 [Penicillium maclennaniae]|uniref:uncharacterized protein n=1 Tax=Penicillium maclennaniae TaxID=1343394 RepID=UPI002540772A|nr:uncharacterized protein N7477_009918 [Penicillium maclennaniae]KAJ5662302.1 hypothetical protein N7477_009918 [Penicillium maclennaniae]
MAFNKKYAGLPDLDPAPDIYETPDLTDEASTIPTTTVRTESEHDDAGFSSDIDREGVNADQARMHFMGSAVDARDVNFSDSISSKRQAYRSKSKNRRRRRVREDGTEDLGDFSDEDESVERRLARLRREVEELKVEMENEASAGNDDSVESGTKQSAATEKSTESALGDGVAELSRALDNLHASSRGGQTIPHSAAAMLSQKLGSENSSTQISPGQQPPAGASMGISSSSNPFVGDGISEPALQPVLPSLDQLTSRLSALTGLLVGTNPTAGGPSAVPGLTTPHLEALSTRVRKLTTDAEALASARKRAVDAAKAAQAARIASSGSDAEGAPTADGSNPSDEDHASKIQALYATLPTIQSLHPLLPSVLERLRSLRACHAGAAHAAESLDALEKRQAEMNSEIAQWREGLTAVEEKMRQGEAALKSNVETVEPWVRDLETRMARLGGPPGSL